MILKLTIENYLVFSNEIEIDLEADMRSKKLSSNVHSFNNINILKTSVLYGQNNVGKTCLVKAIKQIKAIILNEKFNIHSHLFKKSPITTMSITFLDTNKIYSYQFKYDCQKEEFIFESLNEIVKDEFANKKSILIFKRDYQNNIFSYPMDQRLETLLPVLSQNNILIYLVDSSKFKSLDQTKKIMKHFASKIDIVSMNNMNLENTIRLLKNENNFQKKISSFIQNADLYMTDYFYNKGDLNITTNDKSDEDILNIPEHFIDRIRLTSVYNGIEVPSIFFDSTGTKKIAALAGYVVEALEKGRIIIVDELDSGIHFKLTRAIVAMFNNELNNSAQALFTVHDINLLDCKKLFRKEQVFFLDKDEDGVFTYSLGDFTAADGIRDTTDIIEKYKKGLLGAIPNPQLMNTLLDIKLMNKDESHET